MADNTLSSPPPKLLLAAIVDSAEDAIVSKSLHGIITSWNRSAERMFGYSAEEALGKSVLLIIPADKQAEEAMILGRLTRGEKLEHFDTERVHKDGRRVEVSLTISPIKDDNDAIIGASKIARDIGERQNLLRSLQASSEEAKREVQIREDFMAMVSHELRTPLQSILGWAQVVKSGGFDSTEVAEAVNAIEQNAQAQSRIVGDLLDMSSIMSGKLRLERTEFTAGEAVQEALDAFKPVASAKGIRLQCEKASDAVIHADKSRLHQIVWNLLSNAVKFSPEHSIVRVEMELINGIVEITVHDSGKGIREEFLPFVFDRFRQDEQRGGGRHGGLGLGLAIAKELAVLHGGSLTAGNTPGNGAFCRYTSECSRRGRLMWLYPTRFRNFK